MCQQSVLPCACRACCACCARASRLEGDVEEDDAGEDEVDPPGHAGPGGGEVKAGALQGAGLGPKYDSKPGLQAGGEGERALAALGELRAREKEQAAAGGEPASRCRPRQFNRLAGIAGVQARGVGSEPAAEAGLGVAPWCQR